MQLPVCTYSFVRNARVKKGGAVRWRLEECQGTKKDGLSAVRVGWRSIPRWRKLDHLGVEFPEPLYVVIDRKPALGAVELPILSDAHASGEAITSAILGKLVHAKSISLDSSFRQLFFSQLPDTFRKATVGPFEAPDFPLSHP